MKKIDIIVVRFVPIIMFIYMLYIDIMAWNGRFNENMEYFLGNSFIFSSSLFLISVSNPKYHCVWNRAMYIELMIVPIMNFFDSKWGIFCDAYSMLMTFTIMWIVALFATVVLALRHFIMAKMRKYGLTGRR